MLTQFALTTLFVVLALACLPVARVQVLSLRLTRLVVTLGFLTIIATAGIAVARPDLLPENVAAWGMATCQAAGLTFDPANFHLPWVAICLAVTLPALLCIAALDLAARLTRQARQIDKLLGDLRSASRSLRHAARGSVRTPDVLDPAGPRALDVVATEAISRAARALPTAPTHRRRVAEFLDERP